MQENTPTPPIPETPIVRPLKTTNSPILMIVLIALLVLSLGSTIFLAYQNMQLQKQISGMKVASSPTPVATPDPTASWKTYTNSQYGYSFKYPSDAVIQNQNPSNYLQLHYSGPKQNGPDTTDGYGFSVTYLEENPKILYEDYIKLQHDQEKITCLNTVIVSDIQNTTLAGMTGKMFDVKNCLGPVGTSSGTQYYFSTPKYIITITKGVVGDMQSQLQYLKILDQILSTFQFTTPNSKVDTSNWKTYTGTYFSFKYPNSWTAENPQNIPENIENVNFRISPDAVFEADYKKYNYQTSLDGQKGPQSQTQTLTLNGKEITRYATSGGEAMPTNFSIITYLIPATSNTSYLITFNGDKNIITDQLITNVLSTFQFTQ